MVSFMPIMDHMAVPSKIDMPRNGVEHQVKRPRYDSEVPETQSINFSSNSSKVGCSNVPQYSDALAASEELIKEDWSSTVSSSAQITEKNPTPQTTNSTTLQTEDTTVSTSQTNTVLPSYSVAISQHTNSSTVLLPSSNTSRPTPYLPVTSTTTPSTSDNQHITSKFISTALPNAGTSSPSENPNNVIASDDTTNWLNTVLPNNNNNNNNNESSTNNNLSPSTNLCVKSEILAVADSEPSNFSQYILPDKGDLPSDLPSSYLQQLHSSTMQAYGGQAYMQQSSGFYNSMPSSQYAYGADYLLGTTRIIGQSKSTGSSSNANGGSSACLGASTTPTATAYPATYGSFASGNGTQNCQNGYYGTAAAYNTAAFVGTNGHNYAAQQSLDSAYYSAYANTPGYYYSQGYPYIGTNTNGSVATPSVGVHQNSTATGGATNLTIPNGASSVGVGASYPVSMPTNSIVDENGSFAGMDSPPSPLKDTTDRVRNARTRRGQSPSDLENKVDRVYIWELDRTIILFHSLLTGYFARDFRKDPNQCFQVGDIMEKLVFDLAENHFFFNDIQECDQVHIDDVASDDNGQDLSSYNFATDGFGTANSVAGMCLGTGVRGGVDWMRKLAFRYRKIKEIYNAFRSNSGGLLDPETREKWLRLRQDIEGCTDNWLSESMNCLNYINTRPNCVNVLVTKTQLVPALAVILLYGLGGVFPIENIYSSTKVGKESCFERIASRFGRKPVYVVVGDGTGTVENQNEGIAAKQMDFPFWRIQNHTDFVNLYKALSLCGL